MAKLCILRLGQGPRLGYLPKKKPMSRWIYQPTEIKISAGPSRVTGPAKRYRCMPYIRMHWVFKLSPPPPSVQYVFLLSFYISKDVLCNLRSNGTASYSRDHLPVNPEACTMRQSSFSDFGLSLMKMLELTLLFKGVGYIYYFMY